MKKLLYNSLILGLIQLSAFAQNTTRNVKLDASKKISSAIKSENFKMTCIGESNTQSADLKWLPILSAKCTGKSHTHPEEELIKQYKSEKTKLKLEKGFSNISNNENKNAAGGPIIGTSFLGNTNDGHSPMDNSIAISDGGWIVSVANTTIEFDDINGNNTYYNTIPVFFNDNNISVTCDPVVIYDSGADRFIIFAQECSGNSSNSFLLISFSKTNNPNDGFWNYKLTGNPKNNAKWFDYPKVAVSNNELYISGNLFSNTSVFSEAILYQIEKNNGYTGGNINWQYWTGIDGSPFTLLPVSHGQSGNYGPGIYLVSTLTNTYNTSINLYDLTDDMSASNESLDFYSVPTSPYGPAGDASQLGTSVLLDNGSCRALSGFYLNGFIHFVFHSDVGGGWNGINYNRLNLNTRTNISTQYGEVGQSDFSYPSVASFATSTNDPSVIINFGRSNQTIYPEVRAVHCDQNMNWSSSTLVKSSSTYVAFSSTVTERWGDYTGIARKHNSAIPSVWLNGMFGAGTNFWNTWIAEVYSSPLGIATKTTESKKVNVFPNPVVETFMIEFDLDNQDDLNISLFDLQGKMVKELYHGNGIFGKNTFTFNKSNLSAGTYFLKITNHLTEIKNEKLIIQN